MLTAPLFDLKASHSFYGGGRCVDIDFAPTPATAARMRGHRLIAKATGDRVRLFAALDRDRRPFASFTAPTPLTFVLSPRRRDFSLFTELGALATKAVPLFTNAGLAAGEEVILRLGERRAQASETFTVQRPAADETFVVAGSPRPETGVDDFVVTGAVSQITAFDGRRKLLRVDSRAAAAGASFTVSYPIRPPRPPESLAEAEILIDEAFIASRLAAEEAATFVVPFVAKALPWCFYLVTTLATPTAQLRIIDAASGPPSVLFADDGRRDLKANPDADDRVAIELGKQYPGRRLVRFLSDGSVPCRAEPLRHLELHAATSRLFAALPNPPLTNFAPLPGGPAGDQMLFEVVTLIAD